MTKYAIEIDGVVFRGMAAADLDAVCSVLLTLYLDPGQEATITSLDTGSVVLQRRYFELWRSQDGQTLFDLPAVEYLKSLEGTKGPRPMDRDDYTIQTDGPDLFRVFWMRKRGLGTEEIEIGQFGSISKAAEIVADLMA